MKYIIKNCPALSYSRIKFKKCYRVGWKQDCKDYENCPIKQIVGICKEAKGYDPTVKRILDLLEIEEVNEDSY